MWRLLLKIIVLLGSFAFVTGAQAGTLPKLGQTGFSADGAYFSYEQYGFEDGSGFPFSIIKIIDVAADKEVVGSPFEVKIEDLLQPLFVARHRVLQQAAFVSQKLGINIYSGDLVASNPISQLRGQSDQMEFWPNKWVTGGHDLIGIKLETYPLEGKRDCDVYGPTMGFRLLMTSGSTTKTLYQDNKSPGGQFCPQSYQLDSIKALVTTNNMLVLAVIVRAYSPGFEGQDATYLAVTKQVQY